MNNKQPSDGSISIKIQIPNPKPNAPVHELKTIQDIFKVVNKKNLNKFIREFKQGLQIGIFLRDITQDVADENGSEFGGHVFDMPFFVWIED